MPNHYTRPTRFAARLNAFGIGKTKDGRKPDVKDMIERAAKVGGLGAADLNYPDHFAAYEAGEISNILKANDMDLNGLAMRYYSEAEFKLGAFTNPDPEVRNSALDLTLRGLDVLAEMGGKTMTLWMGQDGFDYSFQADYARMWDHTISAMARVADHNPNIDIAIEYKPNEPRAFSLMPDVATSLLAIKEIGRANMGITLDFAHVLYADEMPAHAAALVGRHSRLLGVHLNDGYAKRDDGLMVGTVHPIQTVEFLVEIERLEYDGVIYFDTFPDQGGLDPVEEARTNLRMVKKLQEVARGLVDHGGLATAIARQDATISARIVADALFGTNAR